MMPITESASSTVPGTGVTDTSTRGRTPARVGAAVLVAAIAFLVFARTLPFQLVWDDRPLVAAINDTAGQRGPAALLLTAFTTDTGDGAKGYYRPVPALSLWFDSVTSRHNPYSFHLTNILLHTVNTVLVYLLAAALSLPPTAAMIASLLFAVHPAHVESVAFVSGRTDTLAAFFILSSLLLWLAWRRGGPRRNLLLSASTLAFWLACLSKETAFVLPAAVAVWSFIDTPGPRRLVHWLRENSAWIVSWAAVLIIAGIMRFAALGSSLGLGDTAAGSGTLMPGDIGIGSWLGGLLQYLRLSTLPWPLKPFYTADDLHVALLPALGALFFLVLLLGAAHRRRASWLPPAVWFFLFLLPVSGLAPRGGAVIAERFLYLPSVGLCLLAALAVSGAPGSPKTNGATLALAALVIPAMALATVSATEIWRDNISLYEAVSRGAPHHPLGPFNLGTELARGGAHQQAVKQYREALRRNPGHLGARYNMANSLAALGEYQDAEEAYRVLMDRNPDFTQAPVNLLIMLARNGRYTEAKDLLEELDRRIPDDPLVLSGHYLVDKGVGREGSAAFYLRKLERIDPQTAKQARQAAGEAAGARTGATEEGPMPAAGQKDPGGR